MNCIEKFQVATVLGRYFQVAYVVLPATSDGSNPLAWSIRGWKVFHHQSSHRAEGGHEGQGFLTHKNGTNTWCLAIRQKTQCGDRSLFYVFFSKRESSEKQWGWYFEELKSSTVSRKVMFPVNICEQCKSLYVSNLLKQFCIHARTPHLVLPGDWHGTRLVDSGGCYGKLQPDLVSPTQPVPSFFFDTLILGRVNIQKIFNWFVNEMSWSTKITSFQLDAKISSQLGQEHGAGIPRCTRFHSSRFWPTLQQGHEYTVYCILECTWAFFL